MTRLNEIMYVEAPIRVSGALPPSYSDKLQEEIFLR